MFVSLAETGPLISSVPLYPPRRPKSEILLPMGQMPRIAPSSTFALTVPADAGPHRGELAELGETELRRKVGMELVPSENLPGEVAFVTRNSRGHPGACILELGLANRRADVASA